MSHQMKWMRKWVYDKNSDKQTKQIYSTTTIYVTINIHISTSSLSGQQRGNKNNNTAVTPPIQYACIFYRLSVGRRYLIGDTSHHQPYKLELVIIVINANGIKGSGVCMCDRWWERDTLMFLILSENPMRTAVIIVVVVNTLLKYKKKNNQMKVMQYGYTLLSVRSSVECG